MAKIMIEVTDEFAKQFNTLDEKTKTRVVVRGLKDLTYRSEYNKKNAEVYKEYTRVKKLADGKGITVEQMIKQLASR